MLIIPARNAAIIFPPRTGGTSVLQAVRDSDIDHFLLYRHAERDCLPAGYEGVQCVGFVRNPLARMWSLFKFIATLDVLGTAEWVQELGMQLLESVQGKSFETWLLDNDHWFIPQNTGHPGLFQAWPIVETRKSQFCYLRPDLNTTVIPFARLAETMAKWGLPAVHINRSPGHDDLPKMTAAMRAHFEKYMPWELNMDLEPL